jgi:hypothetical protein
MESGFSAPKGRKTVAQGKRLSAPPWVQVTSGLPPLPRREVVRSGETSFQSGGEGKGSGGSLWCPRAEPDTPCVQRHDLWVKIIPGARGTELL